MRKVKKPKHIILDTDIGGDPDDVFALLLALYSPEIQIDLIVTSDEHKGHRAVFAKKILQLLGKKIPVVKGIDLGNSKCCQICDFVSEKLNQENYSNKIKQVVEKNSKTYYVCIAPQSNLAAFLDYAPELKHKIEIIIMGGAIKRKGGIDHNVKYDINAAQKVLNTAISMRWVISDITANPAIEIDRAHPIYKRIKSSNSPIKEIFIRSMENYFYELHSSTFMHDPLALSYVINPKFLEFTNKRVIIDNTGRMMLSKNGKNLFISTKAKYNDFMKFFAQRLPF